MGLLLFFLIAGALCGGFQEENKSSRRSNSYDYNNDLRDWIQYRKQHSYE